MTLATLAWGWFFVDPLAYKDMASQAASALLFISNIMFFFTSGYFGPSADAIWFLHTWSLSVEWQFYLIYPLAIMVILKLFPNRYGIVFLVSTVLLFIVTVGLASTGSARASSFLFYMFPARAWEMLLGGLLFIYPVTLKLGARKLMEAVGVVLLLVTLFIFAKDTPWPSIYTLLPCAAAALVIAANLGEKTLLRNEIGQRLGAWSYSIYLAHWPILVGLRYTGMDNATGLTLGFIASVVLGWISYRFVEEPGRRLINSVQFRSKRFPIAWAAFLLIVFLPLGIYLQNGVISRSPLDARAIIADAIVAKDDWTFPNARCDGFGPDNKLRLCSLGTSTDDRTLVIGDSYAQMWFPRAASIASADNLSVDFATMAGCPPLLGMTKAGAPKCQGFNVLAEKLALEPRYKRIAIIGSWNNYLDYKNPDQIACLLTASGCERAVTKEVAARAVGHLAAFVEKMQSLGKQVSISMPSPTIGFNVPDRLASDAFRDADLEAFRRISKFPPADIKSLFDNFEKQQADKVLITDLASDWCGASTCSVVDQNNHTILKDDGHIRSSVVENLTALDRMLVARQ
jgi:peptidoglycan/LPS O-acetylase OafA/YrhL